MGRVFVVTGANKGIGKFIVKKLMQDNAERIVYLTSRNEELGKKAVVELNQNGLNPIYHQLDITKIKSIETLRDHLVKLHGGLDVLVNNAGVAFHQSSILSYSTQANQTLMCNYFGTLAVCETLFPILKTHARVCNISSISWESSFSRLSSDIKKRLMADTLTISGLSKLMEEYLDLTDRNNPDEVEAKGWSKSVYGMSKVGVTIMTKVLQTSLDNSCPEKNIIVNCCCPGMVKTDMSSGKRLNEISPEEGADTPVYLSLLSQTLTSPRGQYLKLRKIVELPNANLIIPNSTNQI